MFTSGVPIVMAPLDVTARLQVEAPGRERLFAQSKPLIEAMHALYELWAKATPDLWERSCCVRVLTPGRFWYWAPRFD